MKNESAFHWLQFLLNYPRDLLKDTVLLFSDVISFLSFGKENYVKFQDLLKIHINT